MADVPNYTATQLLNIYNTVATRHGMSRKYLSRDGYAKIAKFGEWCQEQGIDPVVWINYRLGSKGWRWHVPAEKLIPKTKKCLARFREWEAFDSGKVGNDRAKEKVVWNAPKWCDDLSPLSEITKRQMLSDPESCMFNIDMSGGWNPTSEICCECPVAQKCFESLPPHVQERRARNVGCV